MSNIYLDLMNDESNNSSCTEITPSQLSTNSAEMQNSSNSLENSTPNSLDFISPDRGFLFLVNYKI